LEQEKAGSCGYCNAEITANEDVVIYRLCKHTMVHLRCVQIQDCIRRVGCCLCYSEPMEREAMRLWLHTLKPAGADGFLGSGFTEAMDVPRQTNARVAPARDTIEMRGSMVRMYFDAGVNARTMCSQYARARPLMAEPMYSTAMRKLAFEHNFDVSVMQPIHCQEQICLITTYRNMYTFADMAAMGLSLPIINYNHDTLRTFVVNFLFADVVAKDFIGSGYFVKMLLTGAHPRWLLGRSRGTTIRDLQLIDFSVAAFLASGESENTLNALLSEAISNSGSSRSLTKEHVGSMFT
jgi:hypothetical protein